MRVFNWLLRFGWPIVDYLSLMFLRGVMCEFEMGCIIHGRDEIGRNEDNHYIRFAISE